MVEKQQGKGQVEDQGDYYWGGRVSYRLDTYCTGGPFEAGYQVLTA